MTASAGPAAEGASALRPRVLVLGAGFLGLNVARELLRHGCEVIVVEAGARPGGVSQSRQLGGCTVDRFYHTILPSDGALLDLVDELGLAASLSWRRTKSGFFQDGRLHSVSSPLELLTFPVLTLPERLRLGYAVWRAQRLPDYHRLERETCAAWLTRTCGRSVYEKFWSPLLRAKLGAAAPEVSATFIWATIHRLQAGTRGGARLARDLAPGMMGYLRGGYQALIDALVRDVVACGGRIETGRTVTCIAREGGVWVVGTDRGPKLGAPTSPPTASDRGARVIPPLTRVRDGGPSALFPPGAASDGVGRAFQAEHVVATLPPSVLATALRQGGCLPGRGEAKEHVERGAPDADARTRGADPEGIGAEVRGLGVVCELLLLDRPLTGFYITNLGDPELPFTGVIESTHLAPPGEFGDGSLVYLPRYLAPGDPWAALDDAEVSARFRSALRRVFPQFQDSWVRASAVERAPFVQPIHTCDYRARMPASQPLPGLWIASSAQVHPWPVHNDQILRRAQEVAAELSATLALRGPLESERPVGPDRR